MYVKVYILIEEYFFIDVIFLKIDGVFDFIECVIDL